MKKLRSELTDSLMIRSSKTRQSNGILDRIKDTLLRRRIALLGGTTHLSDCWVVLSHLLTLNKLIEGDSIEKYENAFARRIGVRYALSFSSGRVGLYGLLKALAIGPGDEVLLQVPTHIVVSNAIRYVGAKPIYVDCSLENFNMDLMQLRKMITPGTKAIVLQHTFGIPVDMDRALDIAEEFNIPVIEDCVHALGSRYGGKPVGSIGKAAFFSTEETKTISTTMGGMVVTNDEEMAENLREFRRTCALPSLFIAYQYVIKLVLYHFLMQPHLHRYTRTIYEWLGKFQPLPQPTNQDELMGRKPENYEQILSNAQAVLGLRQLQRLDSNLNHRARIVALYEDRLSKLGFNLPKVPSRAEPAFVRYPLWIENRQAAIKKFAPYLVLGTWFTSVLEEAVSPIYGEYQMGSCPNAELAAAHLINLPTHPRVKEGDVEKFVEVLSALK